MSKQARTTRHLSRERVVVSTRCLCAPRFPRAGAARVTCIDCEASEAAARRELSEDQANCLSMQYAQATASLCRASPSPRGDGRVRVFPGAKSARVPRRHARSGPLHKGTNAKIGAMQNGPETEPKRQRDRRGRFIDGKPGPGRPKGSKTRQSIAKQAARQAVALAEQQLQELAGQAVDVLRAQLTSDDPATAAAAAREILSKSIAAAKTAGTKVHLPQLAEAPTYEAKLAVVDQAISTGAITIEQGETLLRSLKTAQELRDTEQAGVVLRLVKRGRDLKTALSMVDRMGVAALEDLTGAPLDG